MSKSKGPESAVITIFGARGDLTIRKLIPALYNLYVDGHLPANFAIFCVDFVNITQQRYRDQLLEGVNEFSRSGKAGPAKWAVFSQRISYIQGDLQQDVTYTTLRGKIIEFEKQFPKRGVRMFYFAVAPRFIELIADSLCKAKLCTADAHHRIVVEKPFGTDLESTRKLNRHLTKRFIEKQIYHIDHYLGKEMVQNIAAFRFGNYLFEPLWNKDFIDHIQISVAEEVGVGRMVDREVGAEADEVRD